MESLLRIRKISRFGRSGGEWGVEEAWAEGLRGLAGCGIGGSRGAEGRRPGGLAGLFYDLIELGQLVELDKIARVRFLEDLGFYGGDGAHGYAEKAGYLLGIGAL